jgi:hypothetical protein
VLRSQTLRMLADIDLTRAVGGLDSNNAQCLAAADSGAAACTTTIAAVPTADRG